MIARMVRTAILAGAVAGLFAWGLQMAKTAPLILKAEVFEEMADEAAAEKHWRAMQEFFGEHLG